MAIQRNRASVSFRSRGRKVPHKWDIEAIQMRKGDCIRQRAKGKSLALKLPGLLPGRKHAYAYLAWSPSRRQYGVQCHLRWGGCWHSCFGQSEPQYSIAAHLYFISACLRPKLRHVCDATATCLTAGSQVDPWFVGFLGLPPWIFDFQCRVGGWLAESELWQVVVIQLGGKGICTGWFACVGMLGMDLFMQ